MRGWIWINIKHLFNLESCVFCRFIYYWATIVYKNAQSLPFPNPQCGWKCNFQIWKNSHLAVYWVHRLYSTSYMRLLTYKIIDTIQNFKTTLLYKLSYYFVTVNPSVLSIMLRVLLRVCEVGKIYCRDLDTISHTLDFRFLEEMLISLR